MFRVRDLVNCCCCCYVFSAIFVSSSFFCLFRLLRVFSCLSFLASSGFESPLVWGFFSLFFLFCFACSPHRLFHPFLHLPIFGRANLVRGTSPWLFSVLFFCTSRFLALSGLFLHFSFFSPFNLFFFFTSIQAASGRVRQSLQKKSNSKRNTHGKG